MLLFIFFNVEDKIVGCCSVVWDRDFEIWMIGFERFFKRFEDGLEVLISGI